MVGSALVAAGLAWVLVDHVLTFTRPLTWGGPNIGGGLLLLLAWALALAGAVVLVVTLVAGTLQAARRRLRTREGAQDGVRRPRGVLWRAVLVGVDVVLLGVVLVLRTVQPAGSAPTGVDGYAGVTVDGTGSPVLVLEVCRGSADTVTVVGPNRGDVPNEVLAQLTARQALTGPARVDLVHPDADWGGTALAPSQVAGQELLVAGAQGDQSLVHDVVFTAADLASLDPGTVQYSSYSQEAEDLVAQRVAAERFHAVVCDELLPPT